MVRPRYALCTSLAAAFLAACGATQPPIEAPRAMPQASSAGARAYRGDLLYASDAGTREVYVFSYPGRNIVGSLSGLMGQPDGVCSDGAGNVFVTEYGGQNNYVQEYAHSGSTPIATLDAPGEPLECSIDPSTGNLAVAIYSSGSQYPTGVAIYTGAQGEPTLYQDTSFWDMNACSYDDRGNLFVGGVNMFGFALAELPAGSTKFVEISVKAGIDGKFFEPILWEGGHLQIGSHVGAASRQYTIFRFNIRGSKATVAGTTQIGVAKQYFTGDTAFFIRGDRVVLTVTGHLSQYGRAVSWQYPSGARKLSSTEKFGSEYLDGVTISSAPR